MKTLTLISLVTLLSAPMARAEDKPAAGANFEQNKGQMLKEIDEHIAKMQQNRSCISGAQNMEAVKGCRSSMKDWRTSERAEHMEMRRDRIDQRIQKLEERKGKLGQKGAPGGTGVLPGDLPADGK